MNSLRGRIIRSLLPKIFYNLSDHVEDCRRLQDRAFGAFYRAREWLANLVRYLDQFVSMLLWRDHRQNRSSVSTLRDVVKQLSDNLKGRRFSHAESFDMQVTAGVYAIFWLDQYFQNWPPLMYWSTTGTVVPPHMDTSSSCCLWSCSTKHPVTMEFLE